MATEQGLCLFDGKKFKSFTRKDPKFKFQVTGVQEYKNNYIVTTSRHGIYRLSLLDNIQQAKLDSVTYYKVTYSSMIDGNTYYGEVSIHDWLFYELPKIFPEWYIDEEFDHPVFEGCVADEGTVTSVIDFFDLDMYEFLELFALEGYQRGDKYGIPEPGFLCDYSDFAENILKLVKFRRDFPKKK